MKRKAALAAVLSALSLCAGCQSGPKEGVYSRPMEEFAHGKLTAAYVNYGNTSFGYDVILTEIGSTYRSLKINTQTYASADEFITDVTTQLNAGNGPDLFLFDPAAPFSFQKMARNGTYADLTPYLEADSRFSADNYDGLNAGQIDGKQYLLPISLSTFGLYTTEENLKKLGLTTADLADTESILSALESAADHAEKDPSIIPFFPEMNRNDLASFWIDAFNLPVLDFDNKEVVLDKDLYKRIADLSRRIADPFMNTQNHRWELISDSETLQNSLFMLTSMDKAGSVYYQYHTRMEALDQTTVRIPIPSYQDADRTAGFLDLYAAVNNSSKNRLLAYETARIIMDYPWEAYNIYNGGIFDGTAPSQKTVFQHALLQLSRRSDTQLGNEFLQTKEPVEVREQLLKEKANTQVMDRSQIYIFNETMMGYIRGNTDDFDACWDNLVNRLTLYLTE